MRTLRAGEGYLGQSSKWLHFGLGDSSEVERAVVHWPDGSKERLADLEADEHYRIVQGSSNAVAWEPAHGELRLTPSVQSPAKSSQVSRTLLTWRIPLPRLRYESYDGSLVDLAVVRPTLLNLWSRTCRPCLIELSEMTTEQDRLQQAGLDVIALCVDGLGETSDSDPSESDAVLRKIQYPFTSARATAQLVEKLQAIQDALFLRSPPLPLPTSVLVDAEGRLAAIYRGPVQTDTILEDVDRLPLDGDQLRQAALPFANFWQQPPGPLSLAEYVVRALVDGNYLDEAVTYAEDYRSLLEQDSNLSKTLIALADGLRARGDLEQAVVQIREAIRLNPTQPRARMNLAGILLQQGHVSAAETELQYASRQDPQDSSIRMNLGLVLATQQRWQEAHRNFKR